MNAVAGFDIHRGCLAIGERPAPVAWAELARGARNPVALEHVGNAGQRRGTFRAAAAFGAGGVLLDDGCADPLYRKAIRTSMGAALHVPFAPDVPWTDALAGLRREGWAVVGLTPAAGAGPRATCSRRRARARVVLVLGHEGDGSAPTTAPPARTSRASR
jgi:tRNA G18 (ribose-2'-O)-methylase SpoU